MSDYKLELRIKNGKLAKLMDDRGFRTAADLSRSTGVSPQELGDIINLRKSAYTRKGEVRATVQRLCDALLVSPEEIYPVDNLYSSLKNNKYEEYVLSQQMIRISNNDETMEQKYLDSEGAVLRIIGNADYLTDREKVIIEKRFNHDITYSELSNEMGVCTERVRQIEARALRKMRHKTRRESILNEASISDYDSFITG
jgi:DNA-directed RNA polymerase sigma subunit (sigma70/sigma32)